MTSTLYNASTQLPSTRPAAAAADAPAPTHRSGTFSFSSTSESDPSNFPSFISTSVRAHHQPLDRTNRPNPQVFGHIPGVSVGDAWATRHLVSQAGIHAPFQAGISGTAERGGAESIVLNGGYPDGDCGDIIWYMGSGGFNNPLTGKKCSTMQSNQLASQRGNRAMQESYRTRNPVRVVRGSDDSNSPWAPVSGYRYDGLYTVTYATSVTDPSGCTPFECLVWRLERCPGSNYEIPVKSGYQSRALEKHNIALRRKHQEDHPEVLQPTGAHSRSTHDVFARHKIYNKTLSNLQLNSQTIRQPRPTQQTSAKPSIQTNKPPLSSVKPKTSTTQGLGWLEMKNALKQLKFTTKKAPEVVPDSTDASKSKSHTDNPSKRSAADSPPAFQDSSYTRHREPSPTPSAKRHCASQVWDFPPSLHCSTNHEPTQLLNLSMSLSDNSEQAPCSSTSHMDHLMDNTPVFKPAAVSIKSEDDMEEDMLCSPLRPQFSKDPRLHIEREILSPLPSHDFTSEQDEVTNGSPIPDSDFDELTTSEDLDGSCIEFDDCDDHFGIDSPATSHTSTVCGTQVDNVTFSTPSLDKQGALDMENSTKHGVIIHALPLDHCSPLIMENNTEHGESMHALSLDHQVTHDVESSIEHGHLTHTLALDHQVILNVKNDTEDDDHTDALSLDCLDTLNMENSAEHQRQAGSPQGEANNQVGTLDLVDMTQSHNNSNRYCDGEFIKDQLDGMSIDHDISKHKYLVGGFELVEEFDDNYDSISDINDEDFTLQTIL